MNKQKEKEKTSNMLKRIIGDYYLQIEELKISKIHKVADKYDIEKLKRLEWEFKTFCDIYEIVIYNWES